MVATESIKTHDSFQMGSPSPQAQPYLQDLAEKQCVGQSYLWGNDVPK